MCLRPEVKITNLEMASDCIRFHLLLLKACYFCAIGWEQDKKSLEAESVSERQSEREQQNPGHVLSFPVCQQVQEDN